MCALAAHARPQYVSISDTLACKDTTLLLFFFLGLLLSFFPLREPMLLLEEAREVRGVRARRAGGSTGSAGGAVCGTSEF